MDTYSLRLNFAAPIVGIVQNVLYYQTQTTPTVSQKAVAEGLISAWKTTVWPTWAAIIAPEVTLDSISARRVNDTGGATYTIIENLAGTNIGTIETSGIAINIAKIPTNFPWQPGHIYVGPLGGGAISGNLILAPMLALCQALCDKLGLKVTIPNPQLDLLQVIWSWKLRVARPVQEYLIRSKPVALNKRLKPFAG